MSQADMAFLCGVPLRTYEAWERRSVVQNVARFLELLRHPEIRMLMMKMALDDAKVKSEAE